MRIAIPTTAGLVTNHLGKCEEFLIADVEGGEIRSIRVEKNPGHGPGGPPPIFVRDQGVEHVLAWGMPEHAQEIFAAWGITFTLGATGDPRAVLKAYVDGTLEPVNEALDGGGGCGCNCKVTAPEVHVHHDCDHDHGATH